MYTRATSLPILYIRNIIPDDMASPFWSASPYRGGAMLLLRAALATLFDELVAAEVAVDHHVLIS
jgi:hypothetical protein